MPKSGSTLICNLEADLLKLSDRKNGLDNGQHKLQKRFGGRYFEKIGLITLVRLLYLHRKHGSFVIKIHTGPTWTLRFLINNNIAKATYSIRDPRDIILSAIDHGHKSRNGTGNPSPFFAKFTDVESSVLKVKRMLKRYYKWGKYGNVHIIKYEDLMQDKYREIKQIIRYLNLAVNEKKLTRLMERYEKNKFSSHNFNKGTIYRYKNEMNESELERCNIAFQKFLIECKYENGSR